MTKIRLSLAAAASLAVSAAAGAQHASQDVLGLPDLLDRLGGAAPDGAGIVVAQVEAQVGTSYGPNPDHVDLDDKTFTAHSGPPGETSHATTVARFFYGTSWSIASGVTDVNLYHAGDWVGAGYLHGGASGSIVPDLPPGGTKIFNNSWVGSFGSASTDNNVLRRADFAVERDGTLIVSGVNNAGGASVTLMSHMFNGLVVGVRDGTHVTDATAGGGLDGPGRIKPEIVGPADFTSNASPMVGAAAAVLVETARTDAKLASNPNAERPEVVKAILLAAAVAEAEHGAAWTNNPETSGEGRGITTTPIDAVVGAGTANIDRAHRVLTGQEQDGGDLLAPPVVTAAGWDVATVGLGESVFWQFTVPALADEISVIATWNRRVPQPFNGYKLADFDLVLWRVTDAGTLASITGDDGLKIFTGGNVVSASVVDNIEHLRVTGVAAGTYALELIRADELTGHPEWDAAVAWLLPEVDRPEDIDGDGVVGFTDLLRVLSAWGLCDGCPEDIDGDGIVGFTDLLRVLSAWD
ncbi:MAG: hypothetical protein HKO59_12800 [Phycisphaerales bacterium]|nr:hypothetical protein [Phycisphaerae bacterium]NNF42582.1 hypothetical protein [Phycisphaerales bacterium]NNM26842.1 hypothetical protein [Phycisphaerales bacterium]